VLIPVITLILMVLGFVLFLLAGFNSPPAPPRNLPALGLACWILAEILLRAATLQH
jgi:hypothetical protein